MMSLVMHDDVVVMYLVMHEDIIVVMVIGNAVSRSRVVWPHLCYVCHEGAKQTTISVHQNPAVRSTL